MRLPFLQVDAEFLATGAADLGELLGLSEAEAGWAMVRLWGWAVSKATGPDDLGVLAGPDMQRLAERAAGWRGTSGAFLGALCSPAIGLAVLGEDLTVSLRGLNRYAATFKKNARDSARMSRRRSGDVAATSARRRGVDVDVDVDVDQTSSLDPSGLGDSEDLPQADEHATAVEPANDTPPLVLVSPQPETKPQRALSAQETLYANMQADRQATCDECGRAFVDDGWKPQVINKTLGPIVKAIGGDPARRDAFTAGWLAYLSDPYPGGLDLPWSITVFLRQRARYESKAANAAGGAL